MIQLTNPHVEGNVRDGTGWRHLPSRHWPLTASETTRGALIKAAHEHAVVFEHRSKDLPERDRAVGLCLSGHDSKSKLEDEGAIRLLFHGYRMIYFNGSETWLFPPQHWLLRPRARFSSSTWTMWGEANAVHGRAALTERVNILSADFEGLIGCLVFVGEPTRVGGPDVAHIHLLEARCYLLAPGHQVR